MIFLYGFTHIEIYKLYINRSYMQNFVLFVDSQNPTLTDFAVPVARAKSVVALQR